jgi:hypothetical protein
VQSHLNTTQHLKQDAAPRRPRRSKLVRSTSQGVSSSRLKSLTDPTNTANTDTTTGATASGTTAKKWKPVKAKKLHVGDIVLARKGRGLDHFVGQVTCLY